MLNFEEMSEQEQDSLNRYIFETSSGKYGGRENIGCMTGIAMGGILALAGIAVRIADMANNDAAVNFILIAMLMILVAIPLAAAVYYCRSVRPRNVKREKQLRKIRQIIMCMPDIGKGYGEVSSVDRKCMEIALSDLLTETRRKELADARNEAARLAVSHDGNAFLKYAQLVSKCLKEYFGEECSFEEEIRNAEDMIRGYREAHAAGSSGARYDPCFDSDGDHIDPYDVNDASADMYDYDREADMINSEIDGYLIAKGEDPLDMSSRFDPFEKN